MKRFILKTAVFLIGFYLLALLLQTVVFLVVRRIPVGGFGIMNAIDGGTINADLIIGGSSRGQSHFNPEIIARETGLSCYNISVNGSRLGVQLPVLKWYLDKNRPPKYAALNIDVFTVEPDPYVYQPYYYLPYLGNENLFEGLARIDRHLWAHRWIPFTNLIFFNKDFQKSVIRDIYHFLKSRQDTLLRGYEANQRRQMGSRASPALYGRSPVHHFRETQGALERAHESLQGPRDAADLRRFAGVLPVPGYFDQPEGAH